MFYEANKTQTLYQLQLPLGYRVDDRGIISRLSAGERAFVFSVTNSHPDRRSVVTNVLISS
jgi:hypothetical protein